MLQLYGDTSGKADADGRYVIVAAGYLATERQWLSFEEEWRRALEDADAREFHATDFFNFQGEFKGWRGNTAKHNRFAKRFTAIAENHTERGIGYGLKASDEYKSILSPVVQEFANLHGKFTTLMFVATSVAAKVASLSRPPGEKIVAIFEHEPGMGEVVEYWNWLKNKKSERWTSAYHEFATAGKESLPLQAADLLAHESWRSVREVYYPSGRPERKSMQRLTRRNRVWLGAARESALSEMGARFEEFLRAHPGGIVRKRPS